MCPRILKITSEANIDVKLHVLATNMHCLKNNIVLSSLHSKYHFSKEAIADISASLIFPLIHVPVIFTLELFSLCVCVICFFCVAAGVLFFCRSSDSVLDSAAHFWWWMRFEQGAFRIPDPRSFQPLHSNDMMAALDDSSSFYNRCKHL